MQTGLGQRHSAQQARGLGLEFFTPEIRFDANYISSFIIPEMTVSAVRPRRFAPTKSKVEQISLAAICTGIMSGQEILTMGGMFGVTTPRNDASNGRGQWDLAARTSIFPRPTAVIT